MIEILVSEEQWVINFGLLTRVLCPLTFNYPLAGLLGLKLSWALFPELSLGLFPFGLDLLGRITWSRGCRDAEGEKATTYRGERDGFRTLNYLQSLSLQSPLSLSLSSPSLFPSLPSARTSSVSDCDFSRRYAS